MREAVRPMTGADSHGIVGHNQKEVRERKGMPGIIGGR